MQHIDRHVNYLLAHSPIFLRKAARHDTSRNKRGNKCFFACHRSSLLLVYDQRIVHSNRDTIDNQFKLFKITEKRIDFSMCARRSSSRVYSVSLSKAYDT